MKYLLILALLTSCTTQSSVEDKNESFEEKCIDGVTYLLFTQDNISYKARGFMSVKMGVDSKVILCN